MRVPRLQILQGTLVAIPLAASIKKGMAKNAPSPMMALSAFPPPNIATGRSIKAIKRAELLVWFICMKSRITLTPFQPLEILDLISTDIG